LNRALISVDADSHPNLNPGRIEAVFTKGDRAAA
jgi:hypothetical protein